MHITKRHSSQCDMGLTLEGPCYNLVSGQVLYKGVGFHLRVRSHGAMVTLGEVGKQVESWGWKFPPVGGWDSHFHKAHHVSANRKYKKLAIKYSDCALRHFNGRDLWWIWRTSASGGVPTWEDRRCTPKISQKSSGSVATINWLFWLWECYELLNLYAWPSESMDNVSLFLMDLRRDGATTQAYPSRTAHVNQELGLPFEHNFTHGPSPCFWVSSGVHLQYVCFACDGWPLWSFRLCEYLSTCLLSHT